ncbi:hypothetical protein [Dolichospermum sp. LEGE 00240]|jgi:hypothetical protein|uniref:hypothetical protein n=1 Tax=Dolichospermum sp. LEGE 00240 TaxID=1828603 RepID=UPI001D13A10E|nr:hypothetical protein [Dolichospermum sp. LEGE 00240]
MIFSTRSSGFETHTWGSFPQIILCRTQVMTGSQYLSQERFISYHHQSRLLFSLGSQVENVLEIGIFNSLFTETLRQNNYNVTTADIDPNLLNGERKKTEICNEK